MDTEKKQSLHGVAPANCDIGGGDGMAGLRAPVGDVEYYITITKSQRQRARESGSYRCPTCSGGGEIAPDAECPDCNGTGSCDPPPRPAA